MRTMAKRSASLVGPGPEEHGDLLYDAGDYPNNHGWFRVAGRTLRRVCLGTMQEIDCQCPVCPQLKMPRSQP